MEENEIKETIQSGMVLLVVLLVIFFAFGHSCTEQEFKLKRDQSSKCFEQTQDKQCWGIK